MAACAFAGASLVWTGGSALMKNRRPLSSTTLAIWALAGFPQSARTPKYTQMQKTARFVIMGRGRLTKPLSNARGILGFGPWGVDSTNGCPSTDTFLALWTIAKLRPWRERPEGQFLGWLCPFRQPRRGRGVRRRSPRPAWRGPVSACLHGL